MKTSIYSSWLLVIAVFVSALVFGIRASAQESDIRTDMTATTTADTQTKVDAGNALNARTTDPADSDGDGYGDSYIEMPPRDIDKPFLMPAEDGYVPSIREGGRTVEAGNIPETQQQQDDDNDSDGWADEAKIGPPGGLPAPVPRSMSTDRDE